MKKYSKLICLLMAGAFILGQSLFVNADDGDGIQYNEVVFDGKNMTDNFSPESFSGMTPGDEKTVEIVLKNTGSKADWYMKNSIASELADGYVKSGGAFEYEVKHGDQVLFSSKKITDNNADNDINKSIESINDYVYLGTFAPGAESKISIRIKIEGETQTNTYQESLSQVFAQFAATYGQSTRPSGGGSTEYVERETTETGEPNIEYVTRDEIVSNTEYIVENRYKENQITDSDVIYRDGGGDRPKSAKTGDIFNLSFFTVLFAISGVLVLILAMFSLYKDNKKEA